MRAHRFIPIAVMIVASGCIPLSLNPVYTEENLIALPGLAGVWQQVEGEDSITFKSIDDVTFMLTMQDGEATAVFEAYVAKNRDMTVLDALIVDGTGVEDSVATFYSVPCHVFWQIELSGDTLKMRQMKYQWIVDRAEACHLWLPHSYVSERIVLIGKPERMERFIRKWADEPDAWEGWQEYTRASAT